MDGRDWEFGTIDGKMLIVLTTHSSEMPPEDFLMLLLESEEVERC